jgi:hypothetical protein
MTSLLPSDVMRWSFVAEVARALIQINKGSSGLDQAVPPRWIDEQIHVGLPKLEKLERCVAVVAVPAARQGARLPRPK